eukprot:COSAG02_NODE_806_length_16963_cov_20.149312_2_plen_453_part_00
MSSTLGAAVGSSKTGKDGRMEKVRVSRHWAGQKPKWAEDDEEDDDMADVIARRQQARAGGDAAAEDPRLRRLAESGGGNSDRAAAMARRRAMAEAEVIEGSDSAEEGDDGSDEEVARPGPGDRGRRPPAAAEVVVADDDDDEDDDEIEDRRARARAKALAREEEVLAVEEEDEDEESESSSEYETETESEEENTFGVRAIAKPVFVRKSERESILEREKQEAEEEAREEEKIARREDRKVETRQKITSEILKEQEGGGDDEATDWEEMPDDDDEADEAALYEAWRIRELRRVKREIEERAAAAHAKAEIERRRKMTDEEIAKEDADAFKNTKEGMKEQKWGFMQKYYHRGAFFQDVKEDGSGMAEPLYQRDVGAKTGWEDQFDRAALPKVKQKRNFGMAGQVKWTHLMDNDTTKAEGGSLREESRYAAMKTKERLTKNSSLDRPARKKPKAS